MRVNEYTPEMVKRIMNEADYAAYVKLDEKGKRLGEIINNSKGMASGDAARGAKKVNNGKRRLLKKYGINAM